MKNLSKIVIVLVLLSINHSLLAQPANNNILVYNKTNKYWYASGSGSTWSFGNSSSRGYLIFDVSYDPNGAVSGINDVAQFDYGRSGSSRWYSESTPSFDGITRVTNSAPSSINWVLVQSEVNESSGDLSIFRGKAAIKDIGNTDPNEVANQFNGNQLFYSPGMSNSLQFSDLSLRLQLSWTKMYNQQSMNMTEARSHLRSYLQSKGYHGTD